MPAKHEIGAAVAARLAETPGAVKRLGEAIFVQTPLYRAKKSYRVVYVNRDAFHALFAPGQNLSFAEMAAAIEAAFNTTIEKERGTDEVVGTAWVDRQEDPLNLSLAGNHGSGRAYYLGALFNVKGEKTPLATAENRQFSDGLLEMERCLWETLVGNALQGALSNGLNGVLAVLDMDELCEVVWREKPVRRGKIIRLDTDGALDRVTHLFAAKKSLSPQDWQTAAESFGRLEGDKFVERIVHGTWSPGNITPRGHLVDFDTVGAVKGRSPQFSSTRWHTENYFGFEYEGQLKVLRAMTEDKDLNTQGVDFAALKETMLMTLRLQIARRLPELMGFSDGKTAYDRFGPELDALAELWRELARKGYNQFDALSAKEPRAGDLAAFDLSLFFRHYPLQKQSRRFNPARAVTVMAAHGWDDAFKTVDMEALSDIGREHLERVHARLGAEYVADEATLSYLQIAALNFVRSYDALFCKLLAASGESLDAVAARAYAVNEDRFYLFHAYTATFILAKNRAHWPPQRLNHMVEALILATRRSSAPESGEFHADVRLFRDGFFYITINLFGHHRLQFAFFEPPSEKIPALSIEDILLNPMPDAPLVYASALLPNARLAENFDRENYLQLPCILRVTDIGSERVQLNSNGAQLETSIKNPSPEANKELALERLVDLDAD
jgi:hypothetical protein